MRGGAAFFEIFFGRTVDDGLRCGVGVRRRKNGFFDADRFVEDDDNGRGGVGRARRVGRDRNGAESIVVDAHQDRRARHGAVATSLRRSGDDDAFSARSDVRARFREIGEKSGGFNNDIDTDVLPRKLRRLLFRENFHFFAVNDERAFFRLNGERRPFVDRVVFQKIRKIFWRREVVCSRQLDLDITVASIAPRAKNPLPILPGIR